MDVFLVYCTRDPSVHIGGAPIDPPAAFESFADALAEFDRRIGVFDVTRVWRRHPTTASAENAGMRLGVLGLCFGVVHIGDTILHFNMLRIPVHVEAPRVKSAGKTS